MKTKDWANAIAELALVADRYPQAAYAGLQKSLQTEWQFLQQVTNGLGNKFLEIKKRLSQEFPLSLFGVDSVDETHKLLACLPIKAAGLVIPNPTATAEQNWTVSTVICGHLVAI
jgi:muconolactone delta-isomerase